VTNTGVCWEFERAWSMLIYRDGWVIIGNLGDDENVMLRERRPVAIDE